MLHIMNVLKGATLFFPFNASLADGSSASLSTNGTPKVYKNGGTTEITTGVSLVEDHDGIAGRHGVQVITTDAAYTPGDRFQVAVDGNVIDTKTVNAWVGTFSLQPPDGAKPVVGTAQGGAVGHVDLPASASSVDGSYAGAMVLVTGGTGAGQARKRGSTYTGATRRFTVDPDFNVAPDATSIVEVYVVPPVAGSEVSAFQAGLATASALATVAGYLDTEVASILAAVDTEVAAIKAKTDNLPATPAAAGSQMAITAVAQLALVKALFRAANGAGGFGLAKDVANNRIILSFPDEADENVPAAFDSSSPAVTSLGS